MSTPVDIQKFAIDVAYRLSSLRNFLEASEDLLRFNNSFTDIDIQRHGRVDRLLLPLTTQLVIRRNHDPYVQLGIADLMKNLDSRSQPHNKLPIEPSTSSPLPWRVPSNNIAASMPPPDVFPPKAPEDTGRKKRPFDFLVRRSRPVHRQHPPRPELDVKDSQSGGDTAPSTMRLFTRARRHFGIFCTGNKQLPQHPGR
ncbi:hypothetical protein PAXINDRAFT_22045 [Paxillus involutus ATCC 200175]|uniref:Uncharacterized protein n=1 Tax=Paxillus involutus ATCC 200175 TaxID=664439 RepID=A0A0C9SZV1_PAXIN|nr:hypothetical protein PAXINDRAFT_22045 [Paxillus involutus ATCC 200175]